MGRYSRCRCRSHCRAETRAQHSSELMGRAGRRGCTMNMTCARRAEPSPKATQIFSRPRPMRGTTWCSVTRLLLLRDGSMNNAPKKREEKTSVVMQAEALFSPAHAQQPYLSPNSKTNKQMLAVSRYVRRS